MQSRKIGEIKLKIIISCVLQRYINASEVEQSSSCSQKTPQPSPLERIVSLK